MAKPKDPLDPDEYGRKAMDRLRDVIEKNAKVTERQTKIMIWLTWVMAILAIITTILTAVTAASDVSQVWKKLAPFIASIWLAVRSWLPW